MSHLRVRFALSVVLALITFVSVIRLADRQDRRFDCTRSGRFTLDWVSRAILDGLEEDVRATLLPALGGDPERAASSRLLLESFERASPRFQVQVADPTSAYAATAVSVDPRRAAVILEAAGRREVVDTPDQAGIVSALLRLVRRGGRDIVFLTGHGERSIRDTSPDGASRAADELRRAGFTPREELWMRGASARAHEASGSSAIHEPAPSVLVVAGPRTDLFSVERARLAAHLEQGGSALVLLDPRELPELESFLREWGVVPGRGVLVDPTTRLYGADASVPVVTDYARHPITRSLTRGGTQPTIFPVARALRADPTPARHLRPEVVASASGRARERNAVPPAPGATPPGVVVAVEGPHGARLAVVGDSDFASNGNLFLSGNAALLSGAIEWLSAGDDPLPVRPRGEVPLLLTERQFRYRVGLPSLAFPLLAVIAGGITARRGRRT